MPRQNGWEKPFHGLQVVTWIVFPVFIASFFAFYTPLLEMSAAILGTAAYAIASIVVIYSAFKCTSIDPADEAIQARSLQMQDTRGSQHQVYCNVCLQFVHKASRHCRLCDKCVSVFDHHCKWLNNCIGQKNYNYFFTCVASSTVMMTIQATLGVFILINTYSDADLIRERAASIFGCHGEKSDDGQCVDKQDVLPLVTIRIIHFILAGLVCMWWFLIAQLLLFHVQLVIEDITTYDYIVRKRKKKLANAQVDEPTCCEIVRAGLTCRKISKNKPESSHAGNSSHVSGASSRSMDDENAAIEAEVDEELEVTSSRGSRQSFPNAKTGYAPPRGFGRHLSGREESNGIRTPSSQHDEPNYLEGPFTPRSPRSDPGSAYISELSEGDNQPMPPPAPTGNGGSVVMYGHPHQENVSSGQIV